MANDSHRSPETKRPAWANAYEAGYRVGYRHGMADVRNALDDPNDPQTTPDPVDVSGTDQSAAGRSGSLRVLR